MTVYKKKILIIQNFSLICELLNLYLQKIQIQF